MELMNQLMAPDPAKRPTISKILEHPKISSIRQALKNRFIECAEGQWCTTCYNRIIKERDERANTNSSIRKRKHNDNTINTFFVELVKPFADKWKSIDTDEKKEI